MKEKLKEYALIAEIIGGFAVLLTLVILVLSVRENTELIRVSMYANHVEGINETDLFAISTPEMTRINSARMRGRIEGLDQVDIQRAIVLTVVGQRRNETAYYMWKGGFLEEPQWARILTSACWNYSRFQELIGGEGGIPLTDEYRDFLLQECPG